MKTILTNAKRLTNPSATISSEECREFHFKWTTKFSTSGKQYLLDECQENRLKCIVLASITVCDDHIMHQKISRWFVASWNYSNYSLSLFCSSVSCFPCSTSSLPPAYFFDLLSLPCAWPLRCFLFTFYSLIATGPYFSYVYLIGWCFFYLGLLTADDILPFVS